MRGFAEKHLIEDNSHRPDIAFGGICATIENLRTHIHRTTNERLMNLIKLGSLLIILGKPKVSNFVCFMLDEDVCRFQVTMNDRMLVKVPVAPDELLHDHEALTLRQFFSLFKNVLKRSFVTELLEKVDVIGALLDVIEFDNIVILDGLHNLYLILEGVIELLGVFLDVAGRYRLDCNQISAADVSPLVDLSVRSSTYLLVDIDDEWLDKFVVTGAQFGSLLLDFSHFRLIHGIF